MNFYKLILVAELLQKNLNNVNNVKMHKFTSNSDVFINCFPQFINIVNFKKPFILKVFFIETIKYQHFYYKFLVLLLLLN